MPKKAKRGACATPYSNNSTSSYMTQEERILEHMRKHGSITSMDAFRDHEITRLSGRIHDLRREGYDIETIYETNQYGTRYGRYVLHEEAMI